MNYNLTEKQKDAAKFFVTHIRAAKLQESFIVRNKSGTILFYPPAGSANDLSTTDFALGEIDALVEARLMIERPFTNSVWEGRHCTVTNALYKAVDSNFAEDPPVAPLSALAHPHPPEISMSLDRLRIKFSDPKKLGFLIMRFSAEKPYERIVSTIKETAAKHGLEVIRADEFQFHNSLLGNVRTFLHGCGFGIAIYDRIKSEEPNANVGLEVGYLMAMNKPVLLLKDKTAQKLQTDLAGELYKEFDPHDPEGTIPAQLTKWLEDFGIVVN